MRFSLLSAVAVVFLGTIEMSVGPAYAMTIGNRQLGQGNALPPSGYGERDGSMLGHYVKRLASTSSRRTTTTSRKTTTTSRKTTTTSRKTTSTSRKTTSTSRKTTSTTRATSTSTTRTTVKSTSSSARTSVTSTSKSSPTASTSTTTKRASSTATSSTSTLSPLVAGAAPPNSPYGSCFDLTATAFQPDWKGEANTTWCGVNFDKTSPIIALPLLDLSKAYGSSTRVTYYSNETLWRQMIGDWCGREVIMQGPSGQYKAYFGDANTWTSVDLNMNLFTTLQGVPTGTYADPDAAKWMDHIKGCFTGNQISIKSGYPFAYT